jgi:hypothetical protein
LAAREFLKAALDLMGSLIRVLPALIAQYVRKYRYRPKMPGKPLNKWAENQEEV